MRPARQGRLNAAGNQRHVVIAGAGIGGLTAALALAQQNFPVTILEKSAQLEAAGAGIQLSPNASRILVALGLQDSLRQSAVVPDHISVMTARAGREVVRIPLGTAVAERYGAPYWIIHRADLQSALLAKVAGNPAIELKLGAAFANATDQAGRIDIVYESGGSRSTLQAATLIGADGIRSAVRRRLHSVQTSTFSGKVAWRALIDDANAAKDNRIMLWLAPDAHIVAYPVSGGRINVVAITNGDVEAGNGACATLPDTFEPKRLPSPLRGIVEQAGGWTAWPLHSVDAPLWSEGRVALLGDAAHAMMPFAAQGAAMAIEDASVLASMVSQHSGNVPAALQAYATTRQARLARIRRTAAQTGAIYHMGGPLALARDLSMKILGGKRLLSRQHWIYGWKS